MQDTDQIGLYYIDSVKSHHAAIEYRSRKRHKYLAGGLVSTEAKSSELNVPPVLVELFQ